MRRGVLAAVVVGQLVATLGAVSLVALAPQDSYRRFQRGKKPPAPVEPGGEAAPADITAASCSQANVQAAVNSATDVNTDGLTVVAVPGGACLWEGNYPDYFVTWTNKNVTLRGAGVGVTEITCGIANANPFTGGYCLRIVSTSAANTYSQSRVTGFTFRITGPSGQAIVILDNAATTTPHSGWRVDHNRFWYDRTTSSGQAIALQGPFYVVIDNNTFDWRNQGIVIGVTSGAASENTSTNPAGEVMWRQPADLGSANFTFIETNVFNNDSTTDQSIPIYDTAGGGGRTVIRKNTVHAGFFNHHWVRGLDWCGTILEVYQNLFLGNYSGKQGSLSPGALESGTGVIWGNQFTDYSTGFGLTERRGGGAESSGYFAACDGAQAWDGNAGDATAPGWPCLGQVGRAPGQTFAVLAAGAKQASMPLYFWSNGAQATCATGGACTDSIGVTVNPGAAYIKATGHTVAGGGFGQGEVDYVMNGTTAKPGYTPYTYPHPATLVP